MLLILFTKQVTRFFLVYFSHRHKPLNLLFYFAILLYMYMKVLIKKLESSARNLIYFSQGHMLFILFIKQLTKLFSIYFRHIHKSFYLLFCFIFLIKQIANLCFESYKVFLSILATGINHSICYSCFAIPALLFCYIFMKGLIKKLES